MHGVTPQPYHPTAAGGPGRVPNSFKPQSPYPPKGDKNSLQRTGFCCSTTQTIWVKPSEQCLAHRSKLSPRICFLNKIKQPWEPQGLVRSLQAEPSWNIRCTQALNTRLQGWATKTARWRHRERGWEGCCHLGDLPHAASRLPHPHSLPGDPPWSSDTLGSGAPENTAGGRRARRRLANYLHFPKQSPEAGKDSRGSCWRRL